MSNATAAPSVIFVVTGFTPMSCRGHRNRGFRPLQHGEMLTMIEELDGAFIVERDGQQVNLRDDEVHENCLVRHNEQGDDATRGLVLMPEGLTITPERQLELLQALQGRRGDGAK